MKSLYNGLDKAPTRHPSKASKASSARNGLHHDQRGHGTPTPQKTSQAISYSLQPGGKALLLKTTMT